MEQITASYNHRATFQSLSQISHPKGGEFLITSFLTSVWRIFGGDIASLIIVIKTIFPLAGFLLLFFLFRNQNFSPSSSFVLAFQFIAAPFLIYGYLNIFSRVIIEYFGIKGYAEYSILSWYCMYNASPLPWSHLCDPQIPGIFLILFLIVIQVFLAAQNKMKTKVMLLLPAIFFILYGDNIDIHIWRIISFMCCIIFCLTLILKKSRQALIFGILFMLSAIASIADNNIKQLFSTQQSHSPIFSPGCIIAFILIFLYIKKRKYFAIASSDFILGLSLASAVIYCMNIQIYTGTIEEVWKYELFYSPLLLIFSTAILLRRTDIFAFILQRFEEMLKGSFTFEPIAYISTFVLFFYGATMLFFNYSQTASLYFSPKLNYLILSFLLMLQMISFFLLCFNYSRVDHRFMRSASNFLIFLSAFVLFEGMSTQTSAALRSERNFRTLMHSFPALKWIEKNTDRGYIIVSEDPVISDQLQVFTKCKGYLSGFTPHLFSEKNDIPKTRVFFAAALMGISPDTFHKRIYNKYTQTSGRSLCCHSDKVEIKEKSNNKNNGQDVIEEEYEKYLQSDFVKNLNDSGVEFILMKSDEQKIVSGLPDLKIWALVYETPGHTIFKKRSNNK